MKRPIQDDHQDLTREDRSSDPRIVRDEHLGPEGYGAHIHHSINRTNLVDRLDGGGETSVYDEDLLFYKRRDRKVVEEVIKTLPNSRIAILADALIEKTAATVKREENTHDIFTWRVS